MRIKEGRDFSQRPESANTNDGHGTVPSLSHSVCQEACNGCGTVITEGWQFDVDRLYADLLETGETWADAQAAADLLTETRKPLLAELATQAMEKSEAARERLALAAPTYYQHVVKMVDAQHAANRAKVRYVAVQTLAEMLRTKESTRRAEMNMVR